MKAVLVEQIHGQTGKKDQGIKVGKEMDPFLEGKQKRGELEKKSNFQVERGGLYKLFINYIYCRNRGLCFKE